MNKDEEEIRCQTMWQLDQDKKYQEVTEHLLTGCLNCITNPKKRFSGQEMLFPNGPPPWIKVPEAEKNNPESWKKYQKKKVHVEMTPEEFERYLIDSDISDGQMVFEVAKFKRCEKVIAWGTVHKIRKQQKEILLEKEKKEKEMKKKELEAKKESERLKKADEKRKNDEKKQQKNEEKQEYLDKMREEMKLLDTALEEDAPSEKESESDSEVVPEDRATKLNNLLQTNSFNLKHQMPWSPSSYDMLYFEQKSKLDQAQQKRIIGMCQNMLYRGSLRHAGNKLELKDMRQACDSEYEMLVKAALEHARNEAVHPLDLMSQNTKMKCLQAFRNREPDNAHYLFKTPVFTVEDIEMIAGIKSEKQAVIPRMETLLKAASYQDELIIPDISKKCELRLCKRRNEPKVKIHLDQTALSLISTCSQVSVMMDATTACHLLSPNWEGRDYEFGIPIVVKTERCDGVDRKIVVLSKPMFSNTISSATIQRKTIKRTLKSHFVVRKAAQNPSTSSSQTPDDTQIFSDSQDSTKSTDDAPSTSSDFLDNIISKMDKPKKKPKNKETFPNSTFQYAVFRVGDARLLIRSNAPYKHVEAGDRQHEMLQNAKGVTFEPRVEYLPNGGAMELGAVEWMWNYSKAVLKMSDSHILYRTSYKIDHVLQVDATTMRVDLMEPPPDALGLLSARTLMLEQMIAQLENLENGEYMAFQSKNKPLVVVSKCDAEQRGGVSIDAMRIKENDIQNISQTIKDDYFHGFSQEVPFQWQIVQGRAPQMLMAADSPLAHLKPSKGNIEKLQRKKFSLKRKFQERAAEKEEAKRQGDIDWDDPNLYADFTNPSVVPLDFRPNYHDTKKKRGKGQFFGRGAGRGGGRGHHRRGGKTAGRGARGGGRGGGSQQPQAPNASGESSSSQNVEVVNIP
ncbi:unnamed protein product [Caenorhabditis brenneri]